MYVYSLLSNRIRAKFSANLYALVSNARLNMPNSEQMDSFRMMIKKKKKITTEPTFWFDPSGRSGILW